MNPRLWFYNALTRFFNWLEARFEPVDLGDVIPFPTRDYPDEAA